MISLFLQSSCDTWLCDYFLLLSSSRVCVRSCHSHASETFYTAGVSGVSPSLRLAALNWPELLHFPPPASICASLFSLRGELISMEVKKQLNLAAQTETQLLKADTRPALCLCCVAKVQLSVRVCDGAAVVLPPCVPTTPSLTRGSTSVA